MAKKKKTMYVCQNCGYDNTRWMGKCPGCGAWNTMVEEVVAPPAEERRGTASSGEPPQPIAEIRAEDLPRFSTGSGELDRVLGGGVIPGAMVLVVGDPGVGKSSLTLRASADIARAGRRVLYVTGEESARQIRMRADRLQAVADELLVVSETNLDAICAHVENVKPALFIIDSIQTMYRPDIESAPGSVSQVRECAMELMRVAKTAGIAVFVIGHVTKEGSLAGPRVLEHIVDTVLYFEGERHHTFRILRAVKNRFGSTNEIGIFEMQSGGLVEVLNPSQVFLEERLDGATGSSIVVTMEGTRPILAEVQALVTPTMFGNAKRTTTGLDFNRASLIMAVLEKRAGLLLQNQDAYLKSAGGVKLDEPAIDLAVAVAIASSYKDKPTNPQECFVGELGLTGEVRRVNRIEQRINEAAKLGFTKIYVPKNSLTGITPPAGIQVIGVTTIGEVLKKVFG